MSFLMSFVICLLICLPVIMLTIYVLVTDWKQCERWHEEAVRDGISWEDGYCED